MGKYFQEELKRKNIEYYIPRMENILATREGQVEGMIKCFECFYSMFGTCPVNGHKGNAACIQLAKSYFDMPRKELEEATEKEYKEALRKAAQMYHIRMDYIKNLAEAKGEIKDEQEELEPIH